jgi:hypothetical protein
MAYGTKHITNKASAPSDWDHEKALAEALAERSRFLEKYPQYREFQSDIDKMLDKSGGRNNRMVVLAMLIEGKLVEMSQEFKKLQGILTQGLAQKQIS